MNELTPIPQLKTEIQFYERQTATGMLEIGKRLIQIKEQLPHGEFMPWVEKELSYSHDSANNFMRCYEKFGNSETFRNLKPSQMFVLMGETEEITVEIIKNNDMEEMTIKKLRDEVKALKQKTTRYEEVSKNLTDQRDGLVRELQKVKPEVVVKEIVKEVVNVPDDYENLKRQAEFYRKASGESSKAYENILSENMALRQQTKEKTYYKGLDIGVFVAYLREFISNMKKYEAFKDDFKNLTLEDERTIEMWINRTRDQLTVMEMLKNNMEVTIIE